MRQYTEITEHTFGALYILDFLHIKLKNTFEQQRSEVSFMTYYLIIFVIVSLNTKTF